MTYDEIKNQVEDSIIKDAIVSDNDVQNVLNQINAEVENYEAGKLLISVTDLEAPPSEVSDPYEDLEADDIVARVEKEIAFIKNAEEVKSMENQQ